MLPLSLSILNEENLMLKNDGLGMEIELFGTTIVGR